MLRSREDMEIRLAKIRAKEVAERDKYMKGGQNYKKRRIDVAKSEEDDGEQYVLDDYDSDREHSGPKSEGSGTGLSAETLALLRQAGIGIEAPKEEGEELEDEIKVWHGLFSGSGSANAIRSSTAHVPILSSPSL
jgi:chromosome transmission fidelity protein 1